MNSAPAWPHAGYGPVSKGGSLCDRLPQEVKCLLRRTFHRSYKANRGLCLYDMQRFSAFGICEAARCGAKMCGLWPVENHKVECDRNFETRSVSVPEDRNAEGQRSSDQLRAGPGRFPTRQRPD